MRRLARATWDGHRDKVLYLVVGGWNTVFQYVVFSVCWYFLQDVWHPDAILLLAYLIASVNGFVCFRYIVFKPTSHPLLEYAKYQMIYLPMLVINMVILPLLLKHTSLNAYVIQALWGVVAVVLGYVGNKYFTFRRVRGPRSAG